MFSLADYCLTSLGGPDLVLSPAMVMIEMSSGIAFPEKLNTCKMRGNSQHPRVTFGMTLKPWNTCWHDTESWNQCWRGTTHIHVSLLIANPQHNQQHTTCSCLESLQRQCANGWAGDGYRQGAGKRVVGSSGEEHMVTCGACEIRLDWGWQRCAGISHTGNPHAWQPWRCQ